MVTSEFLPVGLLISITEDFNVGSVRVPSGEQAGKSKNWQGTLPKQHIRASIWSERMRLTSPPSRQQNSDEALLAFAPRLVRFTCA
jgi:hypothetical protein